MWYSRAVTIDLRAREIFDIFVVPVQVNYKIVLFHIANTPPLRCTFCSSFYKFHGHRKDDREPLTKKIHFLGSKFTILWSLCTALSYITSCRCKHGYGCNSAVWSIRMFVVTQQVPIKWLLIHSSSPGGALPIATWDATHGRDQSP